MIKQEVKDYLDSKGFSNIEYDNEYMIVSGKIIPYDLIKEVNIKYTWSGESLEFALSNVVIRPDSGPKL